MLNSKSIDSINGATLGTNPNEMTVQIVDTLDFGQRFLVVSLDLTRIWDIDLDSAHCILEEDSDGCLADDRYVEATLTGPNGLEMSAIRNVLLTANYVIGTDPFVIFPILDPNTWYTLTVTPKAGLKLEGEDSDPLVGVYSFNSSAVPYFGNQFATPVFTVLSDGINQPDLPVGYELPIAQAPQVVGLNRWGPSLDSSYVAMQGSVLSVPASQGALCGSYAIGLEYLTCGKDSSSQIIKAEIVDPPQHFVNFELHEDGSFDFTPALDFFGQVFFRYRAYVGDVTNGMRSLIATVFLQVALPSLAGGVIKDRRIGGGPVEGGPFTTVAGEHFDVGSDFRFSLEFVPLSSSIPGLRYRLVANEIVHPPNGNSYTRDKIEASGSGDAFDYTFARINLSQWDSARVEFYIDRNGDGQFNPGEPRTVSPTFFVVQPKVYEFGLWYSNLVGGDPSGRISDELSTGTRLLMTRNSDDDWRAIVRLRLKLGQPHEFTAGPNMPDPSTGEPDRETLFSGVPNWTIIAISTDTGVDGRAEWYGGTFRAWLGGANEIVYSMANTRAWVLAHEVGHIAGNTLPGDGHNPDMSGNYLMTVGSVGTGTRDHLTADEARKYDGGP